MVRMSAALLAVVASHRNVRLQQLPVAPEVHLPLTRLTCSSGNRLNVLWLF
jgi:hypothetical protein